MSYDRYPKCDYCGLHNAGKYLDMAGRRYWCGASSCPYYFVLRKTLLGRLFYKKLFGYFPD